MKVIKDKPADKNVVTQEVLSHLDKLSKKLPRTAVRINGKIVVGKIEDVSGAEMLRAGIKVHYNEIVVPHGIYKLRKPKYENHFMNLIGAYREGGNGGVTKYLQKVRRDAWNDLPFTKKCKAVFSKIKSLLTSK
jgi:hypothetical protein